MKKKFLHHGRIGDCIFGLYVMHYLGGGELYLQPGVNSWSKKNVHQLIPFLLRQEYVDKVEIIPNFFGDDPDAHLSDVRVEGIHYDMRPFGRSMTGEPGAMHLVQYHMAALKIDPKLYETHKQWLQAPHYDWMTHDIVCHFTCARGERSAKRWAKILGNHSYSVLTEEKHGFLADAFGEHRLIVCDDFVEVAGRINSSKLFVGNVSCCNAIADGLKVRRLVDVGHGAHNANPRDTTGIEVQNMGDHEVKELIDDYMRTKNWPRD